MPVVFASLKSNSIVFPFPNTLNYLKQYLHPIEDVSGYCYLCIFCAFSVHYLCYYCAITAQILHR
jgi:hypothetical protein